MACTKDWRTLVGTTATLCMPRRLPEPDALFQRRRGARFMARRLVRRIERRCGWRVRRRRRRPPRRPSVRGNASTFRRRPPAASLRTRTPGTPRAPRNLVLARLSGSAATYSVVARDASGSSGEISQTAATAATSVTVKVGTTCADGRIAGVRRDRRGRGAWTRRCASRSGPSRLLSRPTACNWPRTRRGTRSSSSSTPATPNGISHAEPRLALAGVLGGPRRRQARRFLPLAMGPRVRRNPADPSVSRSCAPTPRRKSPSWARSSGAWTWAPGRSVLARAATTVPLRLDASGHTVFSRHVPHAPERGDGSGRPRGDARWRLDGRDRGDPDYRFRHRAGRHVRGRRHLRRVLPRPVRREGQARLPQDGRVESIRPSQSS